MGLIVNDQQMTNAGKQTYSELNAMTAREIVQANNLRLRVIQHELQSIKTLIVGLISAAIGLVIVLAIRDWLG